MEAIYVLSVPLAWGPERCHEHPSRWCMLKEQSLRILIELTNHNELLNCQQWEESRRPLNQCRGLSETYMSVLWITTGTFNYQIVHNKFVHSRQSMLPLDFSVDLLRCRRKRKAFSSISVLALGIAMHFYSIYSHPLANTLYYCQVVRPSTTTLVLRCA